MFLPDIRIEDSQCGIRFIQKSHASTNLERHFHDSWELLYLSRGYRKFFHGNQTYRMTEGSLACIAPGVLHRGLNKPNETCGLYTIYILDPQHSLGRITTDMLAQWVAQNKPVIILNQSLRYEVESTIEKIGDELIKKDIYYTQMVWTNIIGMVTRVCRFLTRDLQCSSAESDLDFRIKRVIQWIDNQYSFPLCLEDAARMAHLSPSYFSKLFFQSTHFHFHEYLANVRVQKACSLLATTSMPIYQIAEQCGFGSLTQFGRLFTSITGIKPFAFRKRARSEM